MMACILLLSRFTFYVEIQLNQIIKMYLFLLLISDDFNFDAFAIM